MAETWRVLDDRLLNTGNGYPLTLWNGGARVLRVYRAGYLNTVGSAVTGVLAGLSLIKDAGASSVGGTAITPIPFDSSNAALDTVTCYAYPAVTASSELTLRRSVLSTDEGAITVSTIDEWESTAMEWFTLFDAIDDSNVQPIVIRNNQSCAFKLAATNYAGQFLFWMDFTNEES